MISRSSWLRSVTAGFGLVLLASLVTVTTLGAGAVRLEAASQVQPAQDEFIPLEQVPPEDQLPAAPLLVTAYGLIWVVAFAYMWSLRRRTTTVERELARLMQRVEERDQGGADRG